MECECASKSDKADRSAHRAFAALVTPFCVLGHSMVVRLGAVLKIGRTAVCLAIPGKILEIQDMGPLRAARVQFGGIVRQVSLNFVPEAGLGDYVMVHVGFALSLVDRAEADRTYKLLQEMGMLESELAPTDL